MWPLIPKCLYMFLAFTPFTFFFVRVYRIVLLFIFSLSNFYFFWLYIEIAILLFIGLSYTIFSHSFTQLMLYFLIQTLASFSMLVFYTLDFSYLFYFFLFFKLGIFPFISWYLNVLYRFPSFVLLLRRTLHKLPPLFLFLLVYNSTYSSFILLSVLFSLIVGGFYMLNVLDLRYLIVVSSMANNGFLLLGLMSGSMFVFWLFYSLYFLNMFFILYMLGGFIKLSFNQIRSKSLTTIVVLALLFNLAALPPFPMFFAKFLVLLEYFMSAPNSTYMVVILVLANVFIMASYCQLLIKYVVNNYSHSSSHLLF